MLSGEGMVFTAGTLIVSVTLGNIFGYLVFIWAKANHFMSLSAYHFPLIETIALAAVLILGQLIITKFISNRVKKQSLEISFELVPTSEMKSLFSPCNKV